MADRITKLRLQAFRGVPETLEIDLPKGNSLVVLGPNATGKSMLADAIEWYFTGKIEYLQREGRAEALRNAAALPALETSVAVETTGSLGGSVTSSQPPPDSALEAGHHDFFLLRGRALAEFIEKTKAQKWAALADILGFDAADELRRDLQSASNGLKTTARDLGDEQSARDAEIAEQSGAASEQAVLARLTDLCRQADIDPPSSLEEALDPEWMGGIAPQGSKAHLNAGRLALVDEMRLSSIVDLDDATAGIEAWNAAIQAAHRESMQRLRLFQAAEPYVSVEDLHACPLCGHDIDKAAFGDRVRAMLDELRAAATRLEEAREPVEALRDRLRSAASRRKDLHERARALDVDLPAPPEDPSADIQQRLEEHLPVDIESIAGAAAALRTWDETAVQKVADATPSTATQHEQRLLALGAHVQGARVWVQGRKRLETTQRAASLAKRVHKAYEARQKDVVDGILKVISDRVAELYRLLHPEGAPGPVAVQTWGDKGLEVSVDFYGTPQRPAHRVLSESYLNALGLALFLAMAEQVNNHLGFIVLDDVLTSFDIEHRGRLARLLTTELADWQWIVLTHDPQLFDHLVKRARDWERREILSWDFAAGPRIMRSPSDRLLAEANARLDADDHATAAKKARLALEDLLAEACEALGARLPFRRGTDNEHRMGAELIAGVHTVLRGQLMRPHKELVDPLLNELEADLQAVLNVESHAGPGTTSQGEVRDAIGRVERLRDLWTCDRENCKTRLWHQGAADAWRCRCGAATLPPPPAAQAG